MNTYDIFISYSRKDTERVNYVVNYLEKQGFTIWIDKDGIESGDAFTSIIVSAIESSNVVLFFSSESSNESEWTAKEIAIAHKRKKKIIPIKLDNSEFHRAIEMHLILLDYVDLTNSPKNTSMLERLSRSLFKECGNRNAANDSNTTLSSQEQCSAYSLKIKPNLDCKVYIDDEERGIAYANKISKFSLKKGEYTLSVMSISSSIRLELEDVIIDDCDVLRKPTFTTEPTSSGFTDTEGTSITDFDNSLENNNDAFKPDYSKPIIHIGTLGQVDHGKTTLSAAISRIQSKKSLASFHNYNIINNAPTDTICGISINRSKIEYESELYHYKHIDCPGHADYVRTLVSGRSLLNGAILVVSATEGPMPQTREHVLLSRQLGIERLVVFMNKCDMVDEEEMLELVEMETQELLEQYGFDSDTPIIFGSALGALNGVPRWEAKINELLDACDDWFEESVLPIDKPFLMPIEDVFAITGRGTLASGRIETGIIRSQNEVEILGYGKDLWAGILGVEMFRKLLDEGEAGDNVGLLLSDISKKDLKRGMVVCSPCKYKQSKKFKASIYVLKREEGGRRTPFGNKYRPNFFIRTFESVGEVQLPKGIEIGMPGDNLEISVKLSSSTVLDKQLPFVMKEGEIVIAVGVITEVL